MREIKLRAWDKTGKHWSGMRDVFIHSGIYYFNIDIKDVVLMQYIGLKDKNGKESYWDDIVDDGINPPFVVTSDYHLLARLSEIEFEVIGNIHENPELLAK